MSKEKLILVPSESMDDNKKEGRNEDGLVRMSKSARAFMDFDDEVEVFPESRKAADRISRAMMLNIFHAYSRDIKRLKEEGFTAEELRRVGFVTTRTYRKITNTRTKTEPRRDIWITDSITDTVIGADPEFLLFDADNNVVRANNVMTKNGLIGCDGAMAELRPHPEISPEGLTANIRKLLKDKRLTDPIENYDWVAGCYHKDNARDYPIGGHIHIGNPVKVAKMERKSRFNFFNVFNKILDERLALPMIKIDGTELGRARRSECQMGKYGFFGEWRPCDGRLEHRTLSGMWLMHPELTTLVMGTAKSVIDEVFKRVEDKNYSNTYMFPSKFDDAGIQNTSNPGSFRNSGIFRPNFDEWSQIPLAKDLNCVSPSGYMIDMLNSSSASKITKKFLEGWYKDMKKMSTYQTYSKYIDGLYELLKAPQKSFKEHNKSIKRNWLENGKLNI